MLTLISLIAAYLIGSISSAIIVCKLAGLPDPRTQGSGNPGASNVLRTSGKVYGALTLFGDALKGFVAVLIGLTLHVHGFMLGLCAFLAVIGHMYPVFFQFKGGKGVATAVGAYFALSVPLGIITAIIWTALVAITRYASIASLCASILSPFIAIFATHDGNFAFALMLIAVMIIWRHRENIDRLRNGTESKFTAKK